MTKKSEFPVTAVRWHSIFVALIALALMFFSCGGDGNGDVDSSSSVAVLSSSSDCPAGIQLCVGTGSDTARLFIQWNDTINPNPMAWIYRFDPINPVTGDSTTGIDMIFAIAKADSKFAALVFYDATIDTTTGGQGAGKPLGWAVGGLGYFFSGVRELDSSGTTVSANSNGLFKADSAVRFDDYTKIDPADHWESGWCYGFWSYNVDTLSAGYTSNTLIDTLFTWSLVGASQRVLHNNSADYYTFFSGLPGCPSYPSSSSNGGDPSSSSNGEDLSSSSSEEISASAKINIEEIHPANRNIRRKP
ncbi:MAG: hypothetical protein LBQ76_05470 [Candidatus Fibromonas sp.]|nr:hypothetical protein [Candidatus Fibromonas sp.]